MEARKYSISNKSRQSCLSSRVKVVNSTFEPLTVLRVLVEGLARNEDAGLWLTHVTGIPAVPRISPFDLVYLDKDNCVIEAVELLPASDPPPFRAPARTALVLPFRTISSSSSRICMGDSLVLSETQDGKEAVAPEKPVAAAAPALPALAPEATAAVDQTPVSFELPASVEEESFSAIDETAAATESAAARELLDSSPKSRPRRHRGRTRRREKQTRDKQRSADFNSRPIDAPIVRFQHGREDAAPATAPNLAATVLESAAVAEELAIRPAPVVLASSVEHAVEESSQSAPDATDLTMLASREPAVAPEEISEVNERETLDTRASLVEAIAEPIVSETEQAAEPVSEPFVIGRAVAASVTEPAGAGEEATTQPEVDPGLVTVEQMPESAAADSEHALVEAWESAPAQTQEASVPAAEWAIEVSKSAGVASTEEMLPPEIETLPAQSAVPRVDPPHEVVPEPRDRNLVVNRILRWLYPSAYEKERRTSLRRPTPGLVAYAAGDESARMYEVANISSTGIYLLTDERWNPGASLSFTLQRSGPVEQSLDRRYELRVGAVRSGEDGEGFAFILPPGESLNLWEDAPRRDAFEAEPDSVVRELRIARAQAFMRRLCPPATETIKGLLRHDFSNIRVANAVTIALMAEELLEQVPDAERMLVHPDILVEILEEGSWVDADRVRGLWAGLLVTSCSADGQDESNKPFVALMSKLTPTHTRILGEVCTRVAKAEPQSQDGPRLPIFCTPEEMVKIAGSTNLIKIHKTIAELADLGLLELTVRSSFISYTENAKTTPTQLGMEMFARCHGHRELA